MSQFPTPAHASAWAKLAPQTIRYPPHLGDFRSGLYAGPGTSPGTGGPSGSSLGGCRPTAHRQHVVDPGPASAYTGEDGVVGPVRLTCLPPVRMVSPPVLSPST